MKFDLPQIINAIMLRERGVLLVLWAGLAGDAHAQTVVRYVHTDALGSVVALTDQSRTVIERREYEPYGVQLTPAVQDGPGYTGHVQDAATGLAYMQQRYYDPGIGRFLSVDPVTANSSTGANFNRYWYANNNPYRFTDPDGRWACSGNKTDCRNFEKGLGIVEKASNSSRLTSEQRGALRSVVTFYGEKGDDSVRVSFKSSGLVQGTAVLRKDGGADITLVAGKPISEHGRDIVHEGSHGVDDKGRGRPISSRAERKETEVNAYTAQAHFQNAENFATSSRDGWTPFGGYSSENIDRQAEGSIDASCQGSTEGSCK